MRAACIESLAEFRFTAQATCLSVRPRTILIGLLLGEGDLLSPCVAACSRGPGGLDGLRFIIPKAGPPGSLLHPGALRRTQKKKNAGYSRMIALRGAGYLCGEKAIPLTLRLLNSADQSL